MNSNLRSLFIVLLILSLSAFVGCGGCDDTGNTIIGPIDAGADSGDIIEQDASDVGLTDDVRVPDDVDPGDGERCDEEGATRPCGSDVGECVFGTEYCVNGFWTDCIGGIGPQAESCNGRDDSCSGTADDAPDLCPPTPCGGSGQCLEGQCVYDPSTALDCSHLDTPCMVGLCIDKDDGECIQVPREDGTACNDGNLCTVDEGTCFFGECIADAKDCSGAGDQCNEGVCDPSTGACVAEPISDGTACDDELFCTVNTSCQAGVCVGQARNCSGVADQCNDSACAEGVGCYPVPLTGNACSDGLYCTVNDICQQGACVGGPARDCSAEGGSCRTGTCDETSRSCTGDPVPDGTLCDDGLYCTTETACLAGECADVRQNRDCAAAGDGVCTTGLCSETNSRCEASNLPNGTVCSDGRFCTTNTTCNNGACLGEPVNCDNLTDVCNAGRCSEAQGGCYADPRPNGTICNDGLACTVNTTCTSGQCLGQPRSCGYLDAECTRGNCDESAGGCVSINRPNGTDCGDGVFCTVGSTCTGGACTGGETRDCSEQTTLCAVGYCDDTLSACSSLPVDCSHVADQCNDAACSPTLGCIKVPRTGNACNDGLYCTTNDTCQSGACVGTPRSCSGFDGPCTIGTCDESAQRCLAQNRPDGTLCNDGRFCTAETACQSGTCSEVLSIRDCADFNDACHVGQCNLSTDRCERIQTVFPCLTVSITGAPEARTWSTEALFEFECSDPTCEFECRVDGSAWMPCDSPEEYIGFSLGTHTFEVRARKSGGEWTDPDRHTWEVYLPTCQDAAAARLYIGCEYWPVVLANSVATKFRDHYAVVVTNPLPGTIANVQVYNAASNTPIAQVQVPGNQLRVIRLPWNALPAVAGTPQGTVSRTRRGQTAYRMVSDIPVNAYQFNPLLSLLPTGCDRNSQCARHPNEICNTSTGVCSVSDYSYTNDASLLLPAHIYGANSQYAIPALPHARLFLGNDALDMPAIVAIVATEDDTQVRMRVRGYTAPGDLAQMDPGADVTVTLNRHEVLQLASRGAGAYNQLNGVSSGIAREVYESDLTGSIISANRPIAVYSGAECRFVPFNYWACDHMEQQVFPLETLGHSYVGAVAAPPAGVNLSTAPVKGDLWRLVAIQNNTQLRFTPNTVYSNVVLNAGEWIEFTSDRHFLVESQGPTHPILLSQYLTSQNAHGGSQGDPSMILPAPITQYRQQSIFTTPSEIATHYVNIVRQAGTSVSLDGQPVPAGCWQAIAGTNFEVCQRTISEGVHTVSAANGVGLTVYGYDSYVSYGYTGGLGLLPTTAINPDW
jgi:hypothetical protein